MKFKTICNLVTTFLFVIVFLFSTVIVSATTYSDTNGTPYQEAIQTLSDKGVIGGYPDGTYKPLGSVTRAEFSAMITRYLGVSNYTLSSYTTTSFKDITGYRWAIPYISYCAEKGIIAGDGNGNAMPGNTITYSQALTMLVRALGLESELDVNLNWPDNYLAVASEKGLTKNTTTTSGNVNRGNSALLLLNALNNDPAYSGELSISKLTTFRIVDGNLIESYKFARNIDKELAVKFTINHGISDCDKSLPIEIRISPVIEKKVIETQTRTFKLTANIETTAVSATVPIINLVKDNPNVNQYKVEIKYNDIIQSVSTIELYIDTTIEENLMKTSSMQSIKFFSGNTSDWVPLEDREYAVSFLKTPVLSIIGAESLINHEAASKDMFINVTHIYNYAGNEFTKYTYVYFIPKGSTSTLIESGVYYSPYAAKKYQVGNYTVQSYAFGKLIAEGKFTITN
jgi:hypothetical protein